MMMDALEMKKTKDLFSVSVKIAIAVALVGVGLSPVGATERNAWPVLVRQTTEAENPESWTGGGPFLFSQPSKDEGTTSGFRPFWVQTRDALGERRSALVLYPLFSWSADDESYRWSVFELIKRAGRRADAPSVNSRYGTYEAFDVWPFWFSRQTGDPDTSYRGLFPIAGTLKGHLGFERVSWMPFPLYVQTEKRGAITTDVPWPFLRLTRGAAHGFALWPLFGWKARPEVSRYAFYLWPLGYDQTTQPAAEAPPGTPPTREFGALPFYTRSSGPGFESANFLWPFFGYTDRTKPEPYHERRYLWPFLVQGRGADRYVNRWGPFYTHSVVKGYDKTWYLWPIYRHAESTADGLTQIKNQVGIFLYWSLAQRSASNPNLAQASVTHLWPFYSFWDNGAGRRQFQFPSPLEVFFPGNEKVRTSWTPFFSLYRYDKQTSGDTRVSLLWNAVTWQRDASADRREFHLGPLLSSVRSPQGGRFQIAGGLFGTSRVVDRRTWRLFWFTFPAKRAAAPGPPPS